MNNFEIKINQKGVKKAPERFKKHCFFGLSKIMELSEQEAKKFAPIRSGRLGGSSGGRGGITNRVEIKGDNIIGILNAIALSEDGKNYAKFVHDGTGIYGPRKKPIFPVRAKVLSFRINGKKIFAKSVKGQKPNPFLKKGIDSAAKYAQNIFNSEMQEFNRSVK